MRHAPAAAAPAPARKHPSTNTTSRNRPARCEIRDGGRSSSSRVGSTSLEGITEICEGLGARSTLGRADDGTALTREILAHVAGRVPVIVTTTHFSTRVCAERSRRAQDMGAAMVMVMPPYHGASIRVAEPVIEQFFGRLSDAIDIPIMIQDAPVSGTTLTPAFLAKMAREIEQVSYFKIETAGAASKLRELIRLGGDAIEGPWDGEEAITLLADMDAGANGAMTGGGYPDGIRTIVDPYLAGDRETAMAAYNRWLPLINYENRQGWLLAAKALMKEGGVIDCEAPRHPIPPMHPATRAGLIDVARRLDPVVLRWGK